MFPKVWTVLSEAVTCADAIPELACEVTESVRVEARGSDRGLAVESRKVTMKVAYWPGSQDELGTWDAPRFFPSTMRLTVVLDMDVCSDEVLQTEARM